MIIILLDCRVRNYTHEKKPLIKNQWLFYCNLTNLNLFNNLNFDYFMRQAYSVIQRFSSSFPIGIIQLLEIVDVESVEIKKSDHLIKFSN